MSDQKSSSNLSGENPGMPDAATVEAALNKLPIIGPIAWLFSRTPDRRFLFLGDLDWAVIPPVLLDQCRLFLKSKMPFGYITWAFVNDEVNARLLEANPKLAPHEWKGGKHLWLIDVVTPFGERDSLLAEVQKQHFLNQPLRYIATNPLSQKLEVKTFMNPNPVSSRKSGDGSVH